MLFRLLLMVFGTFWWFLVDYFLTVLRYYRWFLANVLMVVRQRFDVGISSKIDRNPWNFFNNRLEFQKSVGISSKIRLKIGHKQIGFVGCWCFFWRFLDWFYLRFQIGFWWFLDGFGKFRWDFAIFLNKFDRFLNKFGQIWMDFEEIGRLLTGFEEN